MRRANHALGVSAELAGIAGCHGDSGDDAERTEAAGEGTKPTLARDFAATGQEIRCISSDAATGDKRMQSLLGEAEQ